MVLALATVLFSLQSEPPAYNIPELEVQPSPSQASHIAVHGSVLSFDIAPDRAQAAAVLSSGEVLIWTVGQPRLTTWRTQRSLREVSWSADGKSLYFLSDHELLKSPTNAWKPQTIWRSDALLRNLVVGPRTFAHQLRLFFGVRNARGTWETWSVTEAGQRAYIALGTGPQIGTWADEEAPTMLVAPSARPTSFHPAGHALVWEDAAHCHQKSIYTQANWGKTEAFAVPNECGTVLRYLPNGLGVSLWDPHQPGVYVYYAQTDAPEWYATDLSLLLPPRFVADGRGMVSVSIIDDAASLVYTPLEVPLGDVANAWMFATNAMERHRFARDGGLLRDAASSQLYNLYESELYDCANYASYSPTRPYLITTDIFWELYAAAFEGIFATTERFNAIPAFWQWVEAANADLSNRASNSNLAQSLAVVVAGHQSGSIPAALSGEEFQPVGYYTSSPQLSEYFSSMRYLSRKGLELALLHDAPTSVHDAAARWIAAYEPFVAGPRAPTAWKHTRATPSYTSHPATQPTLFPLSWGVDNEALNACVQHSQWPDGEGVAGRALPSGFDVAVALGSNLADTLSAHEYERYPSLKSCRQAVRRRARATRDANSLYDQWLNALGKQWADDVLGQQSTFDPTLWGRKRLQTGLASWATLRHATALVNDKTASECGEAGFEMIDMQPPRAYVEPDVQTFCAIVDLFTAMRAWFKQSTAAWEAGLRDGILARLDESIANVKIFRDIAVKQEKGVARTPQEYERMLFVARAAEHNFLVFKALQRESQGLSQPDPIEKVAEVATDDENTHFHVGLGHTLEWDQVTPFFGRRQIAKGAVYSYMEHADARLLDDAAWSKLISDLPLPEWIAPFVTENALSCEPRIGP